MHTFQLRSIGTQPITLRATMSAADIHTIVRNDGSIFRLAMRKGAVRPDGQFDVQVTLIPDNGNVTVEDSPLPGKHHGPNKEHGEPEQHKGNSDTIDA